MLKVKPEYLSKRGRREFVVLTIEDFTRLTAAVEDAHDLRTLRAATRKNAKATYHTPAEVDRLLASRPARSRKSA